MNEIIPKILHMLWVGDAPAPDYFYDNLNRWKELMPSWEFKIWTNKELTEDLIEASYLNLINTATKGAQKADLLRYYVVHKYGGYYMDSDITPIRSLDEINVFNYSCVVCHDRPWITWPYIINAFFGSVASHELLNHVITQMYSVDLTRSDIHMVTGPAALGNAYFALRDRIKCVVLPYFYFYKNKIGDISVGEFVDSKYGSYLTQDVEGALGHHKYAATWC